MAIFGSKNKGVKKEKAEKVAVIRESASKSSIGNAFESIIRPRITEKSGVLGESLNVYTFEVHKRATKHSVSKAVKDAYKVSPIKVGIINLPEKSILVRGKKGRKPGIKKALVYLKKGDKIEFA